MYKTDACCTSKLMLSGVTTTEHDVTTTDVYMVRFPRYCTHRWSHSGFQRNIALGARAGFEEIAHVQVASSFLRPSRGPMCRRFRPFTGIGPTGWRRGTRHLCGLSFRVPLRGGPRLQDALRRRGSGRPDPFSPRQPDVVLLVAQHYSLCDGQLPGHRGRFDRHGQV